MCKEWKNSFQSFLDSVGKKPDSNYSIERINFNLGYEPNNCKWIPMSEQAKNKRSNVVLTYQNKTMILADWAKETGLMANTITARLKYGWSVENALTKPVR
jgi:hypothetical protein